MLKNRQNTKKLLKRWDIAYNPYTDLFQIFDEGVFSMERKSLLEAKKDKSRLVVNKQSYQPVMFEIHDASGTLGADIDRMSKAAIITLIEPYLQICLQKFNK